MSKLEYSKKYYDNKLISFTFNLKQNKYGKKEFQNIPQFSKINNKIMNLILFIFNNIIFTIIIILIIIIFGFL